MRSRALLIGLLFALAMPVATFALTESGDVQAQIDRLLAQIKELTAEVARLRGLSNETPRPKTDMLPRGVTPRICALLLRDLARGSEGDDVRGLQEFLSEQGFFNEDATGFFGSLTEQAVARWQRQEGITSIGKFGPISRGRLLKWCTGVEIPGQRFSATPSRGDAPLTVTFSTWLSGFRAPGISFMIDFGDGNSEVATSCYAPTDFCQSPGTNTHTYASNGTYIATLNKITNPCAGGGTSSTSCAAVIQSEAIGRVQILVGPVSCSREYSPVCGAKQVTCIRAPCNPVQQTYTNRCEMTADGATFVHAGACRSTSTDPADDPQCKRWREAGYCSGLCQRETPGGVPNCAIPLCMPVEPLPPSQPAQCLEYFTNTGNKPPVISSFSGPTVLEVGGTGTWTVRASDPENGQLSYYVRWGDEGTLISDLLGYGFGESSAFVQNTTFSHSYAVAGKYVISIVVRDSSGAEAKTTTTVNVGNVTSNCTQEYAPVCGLPVFTCPANASCQQPIPVTYSNRCEMTSAGATFLRTGACTPSSGGCMSGGIRFDEGYKTSTIINTDGTISSIADAYYVCRSGQWKVEGGFMACTQDAMQCPNGQWVGRTGPNCQFVCPGTGNAICTYNGRTFETGGKACIAPEGSTNTDFLMCSPKICRNGTWVDDPAPTGNAGSCTYQGTTYAKGATRTERGPCDSGECAQVFTCQNGNWVAGETWITGAANSSAANPANMPLYCKMWQTHTCSGYTKTAVWSEPVPYSGRCDVNEPLTTPKCNQWF